MEVSQIVDAIEYNPEVSEATKIALGDNWRTAIERAANQLLSNLLSRGPVARTLQRTEGTLITVADTTEYEFGGEKNSAGEYLNNCGQIETITPPGASTNANPLPLTDFLSFEVWRREQSSLNITTEATDGEPIGYYLKKVNDANQCPIIEMVPAVGSVKTYAVIFIRDVKGVGWGMISPRWLDHMVAGTLARLYPSNESFRATWTRRLQEMSASIIPTDMSPDRFRNPDLEARNLWRNQLRCKY